MDLEKIKRYWPNAHPEWKMILRKGNGKEKIKTKEGLTPTIGTDLFRMVPIVQDAKEVCEVY